MFKKKKKKPQHFTKGVRFTTEDAKWARDFIWMKKEPQDLSWILHTDQKLSSMLAKEK